MALLNLEEGQNEGPINRPINRRTTILLQVLRVLSTTQKYHSLYRYSPGIEEEHWRATQGSKRQVGGEVI